MVASASAQASAAATARRSAKGVKTRSPSAGAPTRCKTPSASPCASIGTHIALLRSPSTVCRQANSVPDALTWWTRPRRSAQQSAGGKLLATGRSPQLVTSSTTSRDAPYKYTAPESSPYISRADRPRTTYASALVSHERSRLLRSESRRRPLFRISSSAVRPSSSARDATSSSASIRRPSTIASISGSFAMSGNSG